MAGDPPATAFRCFLNTRVARAVPNSWTPPLFWAAGERGPRSAVVPRHRHVIENPTCSRTSHSSRQTRSADGGSAASCGCDGEQFDPGQPLGIVRTGDPPSLRRRRECGNRTLETIRVMTLPNRVRIGCPTSYFESVRGCCALGLYRPLHSSAANPCRRRRCSQIVPPRRR